MSYGPVPRRPVLLGPQGQPIGGSPERLISAVADDLYKQEHERLARIFPAAMGAEFEIGFTTGAAAVLARVLVVTGDLPRFLRLIGLNDA